MTEPNMLAARFKRWVFASRLYDIWLNGPAPAQLAVDLTPSFQGDARQADRMFQGRWRFAGDEVTEPNQSPWTLNGPSEQWRAELHSFAWLTHFIAQGGDMSRRQARALVGGWLSHFPRWQPLPWRPDLVGSRVTAWCRGACFLLTDADPTFSKSFLTGLVRQARHLDDATTLAAPGRPALLAAIGWAHAGLCLPGRAKPLARALARVEALAGDLVLADGGPASRNPADLARTLEDLVALKADLIAGHQPVPQGVQEAIDRAGPLLRTLCHADGGLALFHGGNEGDAARIAAVLTQADSRGRPFHSAPHAGFERLTARRAVLILDRGLPPARAIGATPHAAPLAFEFSVGSDRLIVNCGGAPRDDDHWAQALAASAAHSTLVLADRNAVDLDHPLTAAPTVQRQEAEGAVWVEAEHAGYHARLGARHRRRLYLAADGRDLRGEDTVLNDADVSDQGHPVAVRFHLHPSTTAQATQGGSEILLRTASGKGWRFRSGGGALTLEDSIYFGGSGEPRRSRQIVINTTANGREVTIKWALARAKADS